MNRIAPFIMIAFVAAAAGCGSDSTDTQTSTPKTSVATVTAGGLTVELLTETRLETGMTPIWVSVKTAAGLPVTDATVDLVPMMTMIATPPAQGFSHSAPVIGCAPMTLGDGLYHCDVVFQMMSSATGVRRADVTVTRAGAAPVSVSFDPITVEDSGCAKVFMYPLDSTQPQTRYVASMDFLQKPKVGLNPVVVTLHTRSADMMSFPPVENATITLDPQMPSMGHGSPGSVNPVMTSPGVYEGKLSFSMDGPWETKVTFVVDGVTVGAPVFKTTF